MCDLCHDTGFLTRGPEGEAIYCEGCARGLTKGLRAIEWHMEVDAGWIARKEAEGHGCEREKLIFDLEMAEYERLRALLRELERQDESAELHALYL
jgi:hypothetical protein